MLKLLLVSIILLVFFSRNIMRKGGRRNPSSLLIGLYLLSAISSIPLVLLSEDRYNAQYSLIGQDKYWSATIIFVLFLMLFLYPIYYFRETSTNEIKLPNMQILNIFSFAIIVLSIYSIVYFIPTVIRLFTQGIALVVLRNNLSAGVETYTRDTGIANTIATVASSLYPFATMLFYIYYIIGKHRARCVLLFISSTSNIFHILAYVGRDGVVFWIITFLYIHLLLGNYLNIGQKKFIKGVFIVGSFFALLPFLIISISRFGSSSTGGGTALSLLSYIGQMVPNYMLYFDVRSQHYNFGSLFPLYWEIVGQSMPSGGRWVDGGTESNVFGTFIKSFNGCFGIWGTMLVGVIIGVIFMNVFKNYKKTISYHHYFVYILFLQIYFEGLFYFREYTRGGNLFILICLIFFFMFAFIEKRFGTFVLQKNEMTEEVSKKQKIKIVLRS